MPYEESLDYNYLINPFVSKDFIGTFLYSIDVSMYGGLVANTINRKNELNIYFYAMEKNNCKNVPLDYFTGKKLKVSEFPDRIEIDAYRNSKLDSTQKYVIIKETTD